MGRAPVVICTAHSPRVCAGYRERGFAGLLPKPFDLGALLRLADAHSAPCHVAADRPVGARPGDPVRA